VQTSSQSHRWSDQRTAILKVLNPAIDGQRQVRDAVNSVKSQVLATQ